MRYGILALVIALFYGNTVFNGFVHDDIWQIVENKDIRSLDRMPKIFTSCIAEKILGACYNKGFYYRPMQSVSYFLTYQISHEPWVFHLANLFYTFILAILVYKLFETIYDLLNRHSGNPPAGGASRISIVSRDSGFVRMTALLATIFFLAHPINSEVINWIGALPELLMSIFTIAMLLLYIKFSNTQKIGYLIASVFVYFLALLSKEASIFGLGLIVLYELVFIGFRRKNYRKYFQAAAFYFVPTAFYLLLRTEVLGRIVYKYEGFYSLSFWQQIINGFALYPQYILKLIWPMPLTNQHSFTPVNGFDLSVFVALLFLAFNTYLIYLAFKKKQKILIFGFFFFLITLAPVLIFLNKLGEFVFSERYLFLPLVGVSLILLEPTRSHLVGSMAKKVGLMVFAAYLAISWYVIAVNRNKDWKDNLSSYLSIVKADPNNKKASAQAYMFLFRLSSKRFTKKDLSFNYPKDWKIEESTNYIKIKSSDSSFSVEIRQDKKPGYQTIEEYLAKQTSSLGTLINQGPALIPNADKAYVKVWTDNNVNKLQFFLFKKDFSIELRVWPSDSAYMRDFDEMVRSLEIK